MTTFVIGLLTGFATGLAIAAFILAARRGQ